MLQNESVLEVVDNSGAIKVLMFRCLGGSNRKYSRVGDIAVATIKEARPNSAVHKGQKVKILIVSTKKEINRQNNSQLSYSKNCAVLVTEEKNEYKMIGTRIFIPIPLELHQPKYKSIISLASEIL